MRKKYMADIIVFSILFVFAAVSVLAGHILKISNSFIAGLITGILVGCIIVIAKIIKMKKSIKDMNDEREQLIMDKSLSLAFGLSVMFVAVLSIVFRATTIHFTIEIYEIPSIIMMFMIISYFICYLIMSKKY